MNLLNPKLIAVISMMLTCLPTSAVAQMTSQQAILKMTRGINLGRCFDIPDLAHPNSDGQVLTQQDFINIKNAGFNFVRLPIRWDHQTATTEPYTISPAYLAEIAQCVDWALGEDLFIIINSHHDEWIDRDSNANLERFKAIWQQVATRFQNHSDKLLFEIINEPALSVERVNVIDNAIFPVIRAISPTRIILFGGPGQSKDRLGTCTYPAGDAYLMGQIHNYEPWLFAGEGNGTWGTPTDYDEMEAIFAWAVDWTAATGIPVVLGEYGAVTWCDAPSRERYIKAMAGFATEKGIAPCIWSDFGWFNMYNGTTFTAAKDWIMEVTKPAGPAREEVLLKYEMGQAGPQVQDAANTAAGGDLTPGDGLDLFESTSGVGYASSPSLALTFDSPTPDVDAAMANQSYFTFDLVVGSTVAALDLTRMTFHASRGGESAPRGFAVFVTTPTTTMQAVQPATDLGTQRTAWDFQNIDLTGVASLRNLAAGEVVTFTIAAYSPGAGSSIDFDNITVSGVVNKPLKITRFTWQAETMTLAWTSNPGESYAIDYSFDLLAWPATIMTGIQAAEGGETTQTLDLAATGGNSDLLLLNYQMGGTGPQAQDAVNSAAGGPLTPGSGLNTFNVNSTQYPATGNSLAVNFDTVGADPGAAMANQANFTFDLTVGSDVAGLDLTRLEFNAARGGSDLAGPRGFAVFVTTPSTTLEPIHPATDLTTQRPDWGPLHVIDLTGVASLRNLVAGQVVTFTIAAYSPDSVLGVDFDNISVRGDIHPEPYIGSSRLFVRVRKE